MFNDYGRLNKPNSPALSDYNIHVHIALSLIRNPNKTLIRILKRIVVSNISHYDFFAAFAGDYTSTRVCRMIVSRSLAALRNRQKSSEVRLEVFAANAIRYLIQPTALHVWFRVSPVLLRTR